jgi:hypothetical protein
MKYLILLLITISSMLQAQNCVDSSKVLYGAYCEADFVPVCGCNGESYINECDAKRNGVYNFTQGSCDPADFNFIPNPVSNMIFMDIALKTQGPYSIYVFNTFGRMVYFQIYTNYFMDNVPFKTNVDVSNLETGFYFLVLRQNNFFKIKRLVKF